MPPTLSPEAHLYFAAGFLSLDTVDILGCIILCSRDYSVHCRMFSRSNHWMPVAPPPHTTTSCDDQKCLQTLRNVTREAKLPPDGTTTSGSLPDYPWPQEKTVHSFKTGQECPIYLFLGNNREKINSESCMNLNNLVHKLQLTKAQEGTIFEISPYLPIAFS